MLRGKPERRLLYIYLANDIMQNTTATADNFCAGYLVRYLVHSTRSYTLTQLTHTNTP